MRTVTVMTAVTTNTASAIQTVLGSQREQYVVQVYGTGTYTVIIEGSFDGVNFYTLDSMTASEIAQIPAVPYLRATTSGTSGASVNVWVGV
ncbi:MAG: hypothetical protein ACYS7Y_35375 [Planctomycetota bacterium]